MTMNPTIERIQALANVHVHSKAPKYPTPLNPYLPKPFFVAQFVGGRGSGKTWSCVQLLTAYQTFGIASPFSGKKMPQRILLFCPTHDANPVYDSLEHLDAENDVYTSYSDDKLLDVIQEIKTEREETKEYQRLMKVYRKFVNDRRLTIEEIQDLEKMGYEPPVPPRYPDGVCIFMVLDDLVGSEAFKAVGRSALTNLVLKNRHLGINLCILTQNLKAIPRSIRVNTSVFVLFKFANDKVVLDLHEEVSNLLTETEFVEVYRWATGASDHDALVVDLTAAKENRLRRNWDTIVRL